METNYEFMDTNAIVQSFAKTNIISKKITTLTAEKDIEGFRQHLINRNLANSTISGWVYVIQHFYSIFDEMNKTNLLAYKSFIVENNAPKTVNARISAINAYIKFIYDKTGKADLLKLLLKNVVIQNKSFLDNVITLAQYKQLCDFLRTNIKKDKENEGKVIYRINKNAKREGKKELIGTYKTSFERTYFIVRCLGLTGVRVSELVRFNVQAVKMGYFDVFGKGGKIRRIYIPAKLQNELLEWIEREKLSGFLFVKKGSNDAISTRQIAHQLKDYAKMAGLPEDVIYPHSFRHMYAKAFLARRQDIALLSDLLGHANIETTRIYLRLTSGEQKEIVDEVVNW